MTDDAREGCKADIEQAEFFEGQARAILNCMKERSIAVVESMKLLDEAAVLITCARFLRGT